MGRTVSFGVHQMKKRPRPLVGTKTYIRDMERDMRDREWSAQIGRPLMEAFRANSRRKEDPAP